MSLTKMLRGRWKGCLMISIKDMDIVMLKCVLVVKAEITKKEEGKESNIMFNVFGSALGSCRLHDNHGICLRFPMKFVHSLVRFGVFW
jgi:hypothetical protein